MSINAYALAALWHARSSSSDQEFQPARFDQCFGSQPQHNRAQAEARAMAWAGGAKQAMKQKPKPAKASDLKPRPANAAETAT